MRYRVRQLQYDGRDRSVLLQQHNGPCPIIAIVNALSLQGRIRIPAAADGSVGFDELVTLLTAFLRSSVLSCVSADGAAVTEREELQLSARLANYEEAVALLGRLERGLDVNVIFSHCSRFEYTAEVALFDLLELRLLHGWVMDACRPELGHAARRIRDLSFNEASTFVLSDGRTATAAATQSASASACSAPPASVQAEVAVVREFLLSSAGQLTSCGVQQLQEVVREAELCVLFRSDHFSVLTQRSGRLLQLSTDQGLFDSAPQVAWSHIRDTTGDDRMCDDRFQPVAAQGAAAASDPCPPLPAAYMPAVSPPPPQHAAGLPFQYEPAAPLPLYPPPSRPVYAPQYAQRPYALGYGQDRAPLQRPQQPQRRAVPVQQPQQPQRRDDDSCCVQ